MGIEHIVLKAKHAFPINSIFSLPFLIKTTAIIIDATIRRKIAMMNNQNKIMVGALSIINIFPIYILRKFLFVIEVTLSYFPGSINGIETASMASVTCVETGKS